MNEFVDSIIKLVNNPVILHSLPAFIGGYIAFIIVHIIRVDNRSRNRPPFNPLKIAYLVLTFGFLAGFFMQWGTEELISDITNMKEYGLKAYIVSGVVTPFISWGIHKHMVKKDPSYKVAHSEGKHNCTMEHNNEG